MGTRKKGSELVFDLQWRNKPDNGGDKSNVIGMYDTPTTTSNFEMFKSYLLKNSGVAGNDVKVTYLTDNGQEWIIDSQEWFEIALSAFRLKARLGEVIFLKLDKISNGRHQFTRKHSNDVETQFDMDSIDNNVATPPEWFVAYMKQFKRDVVEEVTYSVSSNLAGNSKEKENILTIKKSKPEITKRSRKHLVLGETQIDKEFLKTLKYDRKLESKLDKLDAKTKKIKEKKQALINRIESDEHRYLGKFSFVPAEDEDAKASSVLNQQTMKEENTEMSDDIESKPLLDAEEAAVANVSHTSLLNASLVSTSASTSVDFVGGEVYLHSWVVINSGKLPWSSNTELRLTWGSADLIPSVKSLRCPSLKPGEKTYISVRFEIPELEGMYESNWNFYDNNIRFGRTLSLYATVHPSIRYIFPGVNTPKDSKATEKSKVSQGSSEQVKTKAEIQVLPPGDSKPFCVPVPANAKSLLYYPNGMNGTQIVHIPLSHDKNLESAAPGAVENEENCKNETQTEEEMTILGLPKNTKAVFFYPNGVGDESNPTEISVKKSAERAVSFHNVDTSDNSNELNITKDEKVMAGQTNEQSYTNVERILYFPKGKDGPKEFDMSINLGNEVKLTQENGTNKAQTEEEMKTIDGFPKNAKAMFFLPIGIDDELEQTEISSKKTAERAASLLNSNNGNSHPASEEGFCLVGSSEEVAKENAPELAASVMNLSRRIENMNLADADSDSDWESVWSYGKSKRCGELIAAAHGIGASNKYGISESDLIVDLSTNVKIEPEKAENVVENKEKDQGSINSNRSEDNNNNNGSLDNNNCSGESISEVASEVSSDLSSGYDVLQVPAVDEKEEGSGYVYITIDGNKLPVPKHILRPDLLASFEQASAPKNLDEQKPIQNEEEIKENVKEEDVTRKLESPTSDFKQPSHEQDNSDKSHCSATGSSFSDVNSGRVFIFPQHHPGYELVNTVIPLSPDKEQTVPVGDAEFYTWAKSQTQYSFADLETAYGRTPAHLKSDPDPYGPLEQSQSTPECQPIPVGGLTLEPPPTRPTCAFPAGSANNSTPEQCGATRFYSYCQHVPNYQQSMHSQRRKHLVRPPPPVRTPPSAPPRPKPSETSPGHGTPVHILPENLVSGAVNVASSAINTARSVINMIVPPKEPGRWVNGHWVTENPESLRAKNLCILAEMGFWDADLNATLLARYNDDINRVVSELLQ